MLQVMGASSLELAKNISVSIFKKDFARNITWFILYFFDKYNFDKNFGIKF